MASEFGSLAHVASAGCYFIAKQACFDAHMLEYSDSGK